MSANEFNTIKVERPVTSRFDLSHTRRQSMNIGWITPTLFEEVVPGDKINLTTDYVARCAPLATPVMEKLKLKTETFFVPYRLLWKQWEDWITQRTEREIMPPQVHCGTSEMFQNWKTGSLPDYLGYQTDEHEELTKPIYSNEYTVNAFALLAYQRIWFDWYRDQNQEMPDVWDFEDTNFYIDNDSKVIDWTEMIDDPNNNLCELRRRNWEKDYFTSALPWPQAGDAIKIPFGAFEDVSLTKDNKWRKIADDSLAGIGSVHIDSASELVRDGSPDYKVYYDGKAKTSLLEVPSPSIYELRKAEALQKWLELNARTGRRYKEFIEGNFGVDNKDYRLNRSELIMSQESWFNISEVMQTSETSVESAQGNMAGRGMAAAAGNGSFYYATEYGCIIQVVTVMPEAAYFQGTHRKFIRKSPYDYINPLLANIGERAIKSIELFSKGEIGKYDNDFGYAPQYSDWKYSPSTIAGDFKTTLDDWHGARKFADIPELNADFLNVKSDYRFFSYNIEESRYQFIYAYFNHSLFINRPLPFYSTPTLE